MESQAAKNLSSEPLSVNSVEKMRAHLCIQVFPSPGDQIPSENDSSLIVKVHPTGWNAQGQ